MRSAWLEPVGYADACAALEPVGYTDACARLGTRSIATDLRM